MSVAYGGPAGGYAPPGRVNFGWIGESFELFKANAGVWIIAGLMLFIVPAVVGGIIGGIFGASMALHGTAGQSPAPFGQPPTLFGSNPYASRTNPFNSGLPVGVNLVIQLLSLVYTAYLYGGIYRTAIKQVRGEIISVGDIFSGGSLFLNMLGFNIIYVLAVGIGTLFCLVPGFLLAGLLFPAYALIADGDGVMNAISRSMDAMKRDLWNSAAFIFVMGLLVLASYFAFCLGEFVTMPMLWLAGALAYRDMIGMPGIGAPASPYGTPPTPGYTPGVWPPPPGQQPSFGQPPSFGQLPTGSQPPADAPRRSLSGDDLDDGNTPPPGSAPPGSGGTPRQ